MCSLNKRCTETPSTQHMSLKYVYNYKGRQYVKSYYFRFQIQLLWEELLYLYDNTITYLLLVTWYGNVLVDLSTKK